MSYASVESALLALIRQIPGYTDQNTSAGDYRVLGRGVSKAIVLVPGPIPQREVVASPRYMRTVWAIDIQLFIPFQGEISEVAQDIRQERQAIIDKIDQHPTLNRAPGVVSALVAYASEPLYWQGSGNFWWQQNLTCLVEERVSVSIQE